jgi:hypothetical protein
MLVLAPRTAASEPGDRSKDTMNHARPFRICCILIFTRFQIFIISRTRYNSSEHWCKKMKLPD